MDDSAKPKSSASRPDAIANINTSSQQPHCQVTRQVQHITCKRLQDEGDFVGVEPGMCEE
jgi:hypothetical protein